MIIKRAAAWIFLSTFLLSGLGFAETEPSTTNLSSGWTIVEETTRNFGEFKKDDLTSKGRHFLGDDFTDQAFLEANEAIGKDFLDYGLNTTQEGKVYMKQGFPAGQAEILEGEPVATVALARHEDHHPVIKIRNWRSKDSIFTYPQKMAVVGTIEMLKYFTNETDAAYIYNKIDNYLYHSLPLPLDEKITLGQTTVQFHRSGDQGLDLHLYASNPESSERPPVNDVLHTDIVTHLNGREVPSFNVSGRMAVDVRDLALLGYSVDFNEDRQTFRVKQSEQTFPDHKINPEKNGVADETTGVIINTLRKTDTHVTLEGVQMNSYGIDDRTVVFVNDLKPFGISVAWHEEERRVQVAPAISASEKKSSARVAYFNVDGLETPSKDPRAVSMVLRQFDLIGLTDIRSELALMDVIDQLNALTNHEWAVFVPEAETMNPHYAYVYDPQVVTLISPEGYYPDDQDHFSREPYGARFQIDQLDLTYVLYNAHEKEAVPQLEGVYSYYQEAHATDNDVLIAGNFHAPVSGEALDRIAVDGTRLLLDSSEKTYYGLRGLEEARANMLYPHYLSSQITASGVYDYTPLNYDDTRRTISRYLPVYCVFRTDLDPELEESPHETEERDQEPSNESFEKEFTLFPASSYPSRIMIQNNTETAIDLKGYALYSPKTDEKMPFLQSFELAADDHVFFEIPGSLAVPWITTEGNEIQILNPSGEVVFSVTKEDLISLEQ